MEFFFKNSRNLFFTLIVISLFTLFFYFYKKNKISNEKQYQKTDCPKSHFAIAYFGQSNSANSVNKISKLHIPDNLYQYNWKDNKCYMYKEPLIGATDIRGNSITPFAISLANNIENNLLIIPYGIGNTNIESWSEGDNSLFHRTLLDNLKSKKIKVQLFLFHQGESDAFVVRNLSKKIEKSNYSQMYLFNLLKIIDQTRVYFPESHFGLSIVSKCYSTKPNHYITDSQKEATKLRHKVFISADSDSIYGRKYRYDGCHFNLKGAEEISKMYSIKFMKNILKY